MFATIAHVLMPMWEILRSPKSLYKWLGKEVVDNGQARFGIGFSHLWKAGCGEGMRCCWGEILLIMWLM
jgi:hypothetical protein